MPVRNQNWYNLQAGRRYPLDDRGSGLDATGALIRDNILLDCHIKFPSTFGDEVFVQSITVSPSLVSVLIAAVINDSVTTIAAVSLPKPITTNKNYSITPLAAGVAGWLVFGDGVDEPFTAQYAGPAQSRILPRCARAYTPLPIPTIGKVNLSTALSGIVNLEVSDPIVVVQKTLTIADRQVTALEFSLANTFASTADNPLEYFLSDCGQRPESGTCPKPPIETINDISPDCNGNINIVSEGMSVYQFENCGGIGIDLAVGLTDACNKPRYKRPRQPNDACEISSSSSSASSTSSSSSFIAVPEPVQEPREVPVCETFGENLADVLTVRTGRFIAKTTPAPDVCQE